MYVQRPSMTILSPHSHRCDFMDSYLHSKKSDISCAESASTFQTRIQRRHTYRARKEPPAQSTRQNDKAPHRQSEPANAPNDQQSETRRWSNRQVDATPSHTSLPRSTTCAWRQSSRASPRRDTRRCARFLGDDPLKRDPLVQPFQQLPRLTGRQPVRKRQPFLQPRHLEPDAPLGVVDETMIDVELKDVWMPSAEKGRLSE
jgi:hypothetical protein